VSVGDHGTLERGHAIRSLLATPLVTRDTDESLFQLVATHRAELAKFFDDACGWKVRVDLHHGTVRLVKVRDGADGSRPALRDNREPFDVLRYQLLWTVCAELTARPVIAIGDLAELVRASSAADERVASFDPGAPRHRNAFVDALKWLVGADVATVTVGDLDRYAREQRDAVVAADVGRLALLPAAAATPPSHVEASDTDGWVGALTHEVAYGDPDDPDVPAERRNLWARHQLVRALLDDPAVDTAGMHPQVARYVDTPAGRQKVVDLLRTAGLTLERHADVLVAVDESRTATDRTFGERSTTLDQAAGVLLSRLLDGVRTPVAVPFAALVDEAQTLLDGDPGWARNYQAAGPASLAADAVDVLVAFGLAGRHGDRVWGRPAASRFAVTVSDSRHPERDEHDPERDEHDSGPDGSDDGEDGGRADT
jgi:uncharacterized protein (TIGR02678 family)